LAGFTPMRTSLGMPRLASRTTLVGARGAAGTAVALESVFGTRDGSADVMLADVPRGFARIASGRGGPAGGKGEDEEEAEGGGATSPGARRVPGGIGRSLVTIAGRHDASNGGSSASRMSRSGSSRRTRLVRPEEARQAEVEDDGRSGYSAAPPSSVPAATGAFVSEATVSFASSSSAVMPSRAPVAAAPCSQPARASHRHPLGRHKSHPSLDIRVRLDSSALPS
jgi:hypothetical protein